MSIEEEIFKFKIPNVQKLKTFGFLEKNNGYEYSIPLMNEQFLLTIIVSKNVKTTLIDTDTGDPYMLHRVNSITGSFVSQLRNLYENVLREIAENCFDTSVFKYQQTKEIIKYIKNTYSDELEFLWKTAPDNAIVRRKDNRKWYLAILTVQGFKIGLDTREKKEIIDLRGYPETIQKEITNNSVFPGFHMNKKHWYTLCLDGRMPTEEIYKRIDDSYNLAKHSLQRENT